MKNPNHEIGELLKSLPVDYRAEGVARELVESGGIQEENILLLPVGAFHRSFGHEVEQVSLEKEPEGEADIVSIHLRREGLLNMLPPGMVFQIDAADEDRTNLRMTDDAERYEMGVAQARQFFAPFDIEFGHIRLNLEHFEHQSCGYPLLCYADELFELLWPGLLVPLTNYQRTLLLELSLCLSQVCGSLRACEKYVEKFFGIPTRLLPHQTQELILGNAHELGDVTLGVNTIPFESFVDDHHVQIWLGPVPVEAMLDFRQHEPVGKNYRLLSFLCEILLPAELSWSLVLIPREAGFRIDGTRSSSILGYSTIPG